MYTLVLELLTWVYAVRSVLIGAGDLQAEQKISVLGMFRCCSAGLFLMYYTFIRMKLDPFKFSVCHFSFYPIASILAYLHWTSPESAILHNIRVMAAVTALSSAVMSSVGNMLRLFETPENAELDISRMFMPIPFLARIPSHLMRHTFYNTFLKHPQQEELTLFINLVVFPQMALLVAKYWLNSSVPFWSLIPQHMWNWVEVYAGLVFLYLLILLVDGGVRNNKPLKPRRGYPTPPPPQEESVFDHILGGGAGVGTSQKPRASRRRTGIPKQPKQAPSNMDADALQALLSQMQGQ